MSYDFFHAIGLVLKCFGQLVDLLVFEQVIGIALVLYLLKFCFMGSLDPFDFQVLFMQRLSQFIFPVHLSIHILLFQLIILLLSLFGLLLESITEFIKFLQQMFVLDDQFI